MNKCAGMEMASVMPMMTCLMEHFAKQDKTNKATNKRLDIIFAAFMPNTTIDSEQTPMRVFFPTMELVRQPCEKSLIYRVQ